MNKSTNFFIYRTGLVIILTLSSFFLWGQDFIEKSLINKYNEARSDSDRILQLGQLSAYYFANKDFVKGDSVIEKQIMLAEATLNKNLIILAYFGNAGYRSPGAATKDRSINAIEYINRALGYAKANDLPDYTALAYSNLAALNITDGQLDDAFKNANLAFTTALNTDNDSAKIICAIELGNVYFQRSDVLMAFKTYTTAKNIATLTENERLLPPVFIAMANLYKKLDNI